MPTTLSNASIVQIYTLMHIGQRKETGLEFSLHGDIIEVAAAALTTFIDSFTSCRLVFPVSNALKR